MPDASSQHVVSPTEFSLDRSNTSVDKGFERRLMECNSTISALQMRREIFYKAKRWASFNMFVDTSCVVVGSLLFYETYRVANEELSFIRAVTANPFVRRTFTPIPLFSTFLILYGFMSVPADFVTLQTAKRYIQHENQTIAHLEDTVRDIQNSGK
ncbi:hypothetical protein AGDE_11026 [Angomonas deanei]|uniref:Uncharacterized protein n=1 Tax=Angomonas deanei TaxID=59799 RepID=A0A7G2CJ74_9TRYP|nr:hypothetical protein AGDE_11026 [Angomonas deanei]CAD2218312.1 hypothetical protein, conserved [Angomonas deanei]|eukprot:EPY26919.1 hypothetical protein AGDE_11026 [Angomonas deanei]